MIFGRGMVSVRGTRLQGGSGEVNGAGGEGVTVVLMCCILRRPLRFLVCLLGAFGAHVGASPRHDGDGLLLSLLGYSGGLDIKYYSLSVGMWWGMKDWVSAIGRATHGRTSK